MKGSGMEKSSITVEDKLIDSFKHLVLHMPVDKITIKDITDGAGVIRTTFYYHFEDKYQLIERILIRDLIEPIIPLLENEMIDELILLIFKSLDHQKEFFRALSNMEGAVSFRQVATHVVSKMLSEYLEGKVSAQGRAILEAKYYFLNSEQISDYYAQNIVYIMTTWVQTDMQVTPEQALKVLQHVLKHSVEDIFMELCD